jgi:hypothetical protein
MKIRFEKVEIEIPREFIDTIGNGLLRLKSFDTESQQRQAGARESMVQNIVLTAIGMLREAMSKLAPKTDTDADTAPPREQAKNGQGQGQ